jgi:hypothetical protein
MDAVVDRLRALKVPVETTDGGMRVRDPAANAIVVRND